MNCLFYFNQTNFICVGSGRRGVRDGKHFSKTVFFLILTVDKIHSFINALFWLGCIQKSNLYVKLSNECRGVKTTKSASKIQWSESVK